MQVLAVDVGTGTQDIFLLQTGLGLENGLKLVMPSPTMIVRRRIREATRAGRAILLTGVTMGGGPSHWAAEEHVRAGYRLYATPDAARSFNDDLEWVQREMGVVLVGADEAVRLPDAVHIELSDLDYPAIARAFQAFGADLRPAAVGVAVFDHGAAPPQESDRQFRFDYLEAVIRSRNQLSAFAYRAEAIPPAMTRMQAVARSAGRVDAPVMVMDTAPAAVLGATLDRVVADRRRALIANVGNFHVTAFRLGPDAVEGVLEHHTGLLTTERLDHLLRKLADGSLTHQEVFDDMGHGARVWQAEPYPLDRGAFDVAVTGPRRSLMQRSGLRTYFAVPYGDMMLAGCFGLLRAMVEVLPEVSEPVAAALAGDGADSAPWDVGE